MRAIIVTGDRHATEEQWSNVVYDVIKAAVKPYVPFVLLHGNCDGIDLIAAGVGERMIGVSVVPVPSLWDKHGRRAAGPRRNAAMLRRLLTLQEHGYDVRVYAFHDDLHGSKGTKDMTEQARAAGVVVRLFRSDGSSEVLP